MTVEAPVPAAPQGAAPAPEQLPPEPQPRVLVRGAIAELSGTFPTVSRAIGAERITTTAVGMLDRGNHTPGGN